MSAQIPSQVSFVLLLTVSQTPAMASFIAVNFSSTAVFMVSHRVDTNSLMDSHISDVLLLTFSQAVLMDVLIALNNVLAKDLIQFQMVFKSILIPFQIVLVAPDTAVHARLTTFWMNVTAPDTSSFNASQIPEKISLMPSQARLQSPVNTPTTKSITPPKAVSNPSITPETDSQNPKNVSMAACRHEAITGATFVINHSMNGCMAPVHNFVTASATFPPNSKNLSISGLRYWSLNSTNRVDKFCNTGRIWVLYRLSHKVPISVNPCLKVASMGATCSSYVVPIFSKVSAVKSLIVEKTGSTALNVSSRVVLI